MAKVVFTHKPGSRYDDLPEWRYHFPRTYLRQVEAALGDFIVYYEPGRRGPGDNLREGRKAYFATARLVRIERDPTRGDHYYAHVEDYLEFLRPVPFREDGFYYEHRLRKGDGTVNKGAFGRAVRVLDDYEYELICRAGFAEELRMEPPSLPSVPERMLAEPPAVFARPIVETLVTRPFRDRAFARAVQGAYGQTCAFTGLRIINGGGRPEVQAAHIRPVADQGPDSVRNGIALSATLHWLFDRGLVSIAPDHGILVAERQIPERLLSLLNPDRRIRLPSDPRLRPAPAFLEYHRQRVFKGSSTSTSRRRIR